MKLLIFGRTGNISRALTSRLKGTSPFELVQVGKDDADFLKPQQPLEVLEKIDPDIVINAAAYTAVDKAESEREQASLLNAVTPGKIAEWCAQKNRVMVHYSTDYVFDGSGIHLWKESDPTGPVNWYGKTKLEGEQLIQKANPRHLIFRTSWIFAPDGLNFFLTIMRLASQREDLSIVDDQIGSPTYNHCIADATVEALSKAVRMPSFPSGVYHMTNSEFTSWYGFAKAIVEEARRRNIPLKLKILKTTTTAAYGAPAARPMNSRLDNRKLKDVFGVQLAAWDNHLADCFDRSDFVKQLKNGN